MERDERDVGPLGLEPLDQVVPRVERDDVVALGERILDPRARAQRNLPLERPPALEDRDLHASGSRRRMGTTSAAGV